MNPCSRRVASGRTLIYALLLAGPADAESSPPPTADESPPLIAVIIDDLGNLRIPGTRTVALYGPVACAILPHTPHAIDVAERAHAAGKEVLLHLPLQAMNGAPAAQPGEISLNNTRSQFAQLFDADLEAIPHAVGINTHMGSLITQHPGHMRWLMEEMQAHGNLFFIDSYTTDSSVGLMMALEHGIPATRRNVFLDHVPEPGAIEQEFDRLKRLARQQGYAVAVGHPYPETLEFLERVLPSLEEQGYSLVPVALVIERQLQDAEKSQTLPAPAVPID